MHTDTPTTKIAIIGAGIGGITAAIYLQDKLGIRDYTIIERATGVGGTWRQNTYPGCSSDIPAHWYSLSTDPNPDWSHVWPGQAEIRTYWEKLAVKHKIESRVQYRSEMISAVWSEEKKYYTLLVRDTETQATREIVAHIVISATGVFNLPRWPDIPGRESFHGDLLHAEHWNHDVKLRGKRVGVIGNGCSGSQIVSELSKDGSIDIINFCRTPSWIFPRPQTRIYPWVRWVFRHIPFALKSFRWLLAGLFEIMYRNMRTDGISKLIHPLIEKVAVSYMKQMAPKKYHDKLIPNYPFGCKRVVFDPGYLAALNLPNVELEWDPIVRIVPEGIVTASGKTTNLDVIAFATGFDIESSLTLDVTGVNSQTIRGYYQQEGGPTGYMGTFIPGFPNWVTLFGPNIATGHSSVVFAEEIQMNYVAQLIKPVLQGKIKSFAPRAKETSIWNDWVQSELSNYHIWSSCSSWYRAGSQQKGKIAALWPGSCTYMWWSFRKPLFENFELDGGEIWLRRKQSLDLVKLFVVSSILLAVAYMKVANN